LESLKRFRIQIIFKWLGQKAVGAESGLWWKW